jgi:hypothetical protein
MNRNSTAKRRRAALFLALVMLPGLLFAHEGGAHVPSHRAKVEVEAFHTLARVEIVQEFLNPWRVVGHAQLVTPASDVALLIETRVDNLDTDRRECKRITQTPLTSRLGEEIPELAPGCRVVTRSVYLVDLSGYGGHSAAMSLELPPNRYRFQLGVEMKIHTSHDLRSLSVSQLPRLPTPVRNPSGLYEVLHDPVMFESIKRRYGISYGFQSVPKGDPLVLSMAEAGKWAPDGLALKAGDEAELLEAFSRYREQLEEVRERKLEERRLAYQPKNDLISKVKMFFDVVEFVFNPGH